MYTYAFSEVIQVLVGKSAAPMQLFVMADSNGKAR